MVCANPDVVVERGDSLVYCAGALADAYVALGGETLYCGKPHAPIYSAAATIRRSRSRALVLNEMITSAFRATVISMVQLGTRASFALLGPLVGYGIDAWGLPSVLSALGILFSIAFAFLLLPLVLSPAERLRA